MGETRVRIQESERNLLKKYDFKEDKLKRSTLSQFARSQSNRSSLQYSESQDCDSPSEKQGQFEHNKLDLQSSSSSDIIIGGQQEDSDRENDQKEKAKSNEQPKISTLTVDLLDIFNQPQTSDQLTPDQMKSPGFTQFYNNIVSSSSNGTQKQSENNQGKIDQSSSSESDSFVLQFEKKDSVNQKRNSKSSNNKRSSAHLVNQQDLQFLSLQNKRTSQFYSQRLSSNYFTPRSRTRRGLNLDQGPIFRISSLSENNTNQSLSLAGQMKNLDYLLYQGAQSEKGQRGNQSKKSTNLINFVKHSSIFDNSINLIRFKEIISMASNYLKISQPRKTELGLKEILHFDYKNCLKVLTHFLLVSANMMVLWHLIWVDGYLSLTRKILLTSSTLMTIALGSCTKSQSNQLYLRILKLVPSLSQRVNNPKDTQFICHMLLLFIQQLLAFSSCGVFIGTVQQYFSTGYLIFGKKKITDSRVQEFLQLHGLILFVQLVMQLILSMEVTRLLPLTAMSGVMCFFMLIVSTQLNLQHQLNQRKNELMIGSLEELVESTPNGVILFQFNTNKRSQQERSRRPSQLIFQDSQQHSEVKTLNILLANQQFYQHFSHQKASKVNLIECLKDKNLLEVYFDENNDINRTDSIKMSMEDLMTHNCHEFFRDSYFVLYKQLNEGENSNQYSLSIQKGDDTKSQVEVILLKIRIEKIRVGETELLAFYTVNKTHLVNFQSQRLRSMYQEAISTTISHEQMNPLNSILNFTDYLLKKLNHLLITQNQEESGSFDEKSIESDSSLSSDDLRESDEEEIIMIPKRDLKQQKRVVRIVHDSSCLLKLMNSAIINSNLIKQCQFSPSISLVKSPLKLLSRFTELFQSQIKQKSIELTLAYEVQGDQELVLKLKQYGLRLDQGLYQQILYSILINAFKFNKVNGFIRINVSLQHVQTNHLIEGTDLESQAQNVILITEIEDSGQGISEQRKKQLFKVFEGVRIQSIQNQLQLNQFQQEEIVQNDCHGHGLGLYLSLQLVKYMQGDIFIESELGKGTTVRVQFVTEFGTELLKMKKHRMSYNPRSVSNNHVNVLKDSQRSKSFEVQNSFKSSNSSQQFSDVNQSQYSGKVHRLSISREGLEIERTQQNLSSESEYSHESNTNPLSPLTMEPYNKVDVIRPQDYNEEESKVPDQKAKIQNSRECAEITVINLDGLSDSSSISSSENKSPITNVFYSPLSKNTNNYKKTDQQENSFDIVISDDDSPLDELQLTSLDDYYKPSLVRMGDQEELKEEDKRQLEEYIKSYKHNSDQIDTNLDQKDRKRVESIFESAKTAQEKVRQGQKQLEEDKNRMMEEANQVRSSIQFKNSNIIADIIRFSQFQIKTPATNPIFDSFQQTGFVEEQKVQENYKSQHENSSDSAQILNFSPPRDFQVSPTHQKSQQINSLNVIDAVSPTQSIFSQDSRQSKRTPIRRNQAFNKILTKKDDKSNQQVKRKQSKDMLWKCGCNRSPILIVDDDAFNIMTLKLMIKNKFHIVCDTADNGLNALNKFKERCDQSKAEIVNKQLSCTQKCSRMSYELIFMDINMPVMDGITSTTHILNFFKEFKTSLNDYPEQSSLFNPPNIVALTAFQNDSYKQKCFEAGMKYVLNKPAHCKYIYRAIYKYVSVQAPQIAKESAEDLNEKPKKFDILFIDGGLNSSSENEQPIMPVKRSSNSKWLEERKKE